MRRRPRLLGGKSRRRIPRAMLSTTHMRSIVRVLAGVEPVLIDCRDEELRPPVQLRPLRPAGGSLPTLRSRQHLLLIGLQRDGAQAGAALCGQRYQGSSRGRRKHAQRQQRYRRRRLDQTSENEAGGQKVTHHPLTRERRRPVVPQTPTRRRGTRPFGDERLAGVFRCHRCGRFCARFIYPGLRPVRRRRERGEMTIDKKTRAEILRLHHAEKWKIGTIASQLGVHHITVRRVLADDEVPRHMRRQRRSKLDPFMPFIRQPHAPARSPSARWSPSRRRPRGPW